MERRLSQEQIRKLYALCEKNSIYDVDLQDEIVDHIATGIEDLWRENQDLTFGWALNHLLKPEKTNAFRDLKKAMVKSTRRGLRDEFGRVMVDYFSSSKVASFVVLCCVIFTALVLVDKNAWIIVLFSIAIAVISLWYNFSYFPRKFSVQLRQNKTLRKLSLLNQVRKSADRYLTQPLFFLILSSVLNQTNFIGVELLISIVMSLLVAMYYNYFFVLPHLLRKSITKNYPELIVK